MLVAQESFFRSEPQEEGISWGELIQKHGPNYSSQIDNVERVNEINKIIKRMKGCKKGKVELVNQLLNLTNSERDYYLDLTRLIEAQGAVEIMIVKLDETREALQRGELEPNEQRYHVKVVDFSAKIREPHLKWALRTRLGKY